MVIIMPPVQLSTLKVSAMAPSDTERGRYALVSDNRLYLADITSQTAVETASLPHIDSGNHEITLCFRHPYICATQRFGLHAALVNVETGKVAELERKDYHSNVSSYSAAFVEREGRILLICQTEWNRLDIYDAASGDNLTQREVYYRDSGEKKNYLDYFHSQLIVSPDGKHFLSNGWIWQPYDRIYLFNTEEFLKSYEMCYVHADSGFSSGYNWDRPCAFIDSSTFVVVLDDALKSGYLDEEEARSYEYYQLAFFKTDTEVCADQYGHRRIEPCHKVKCAAFTPNKNGEVAGKLYYDQGSQRIIAITQDKGAFILSVEGDILDTLPDITAVVPPERGDFKSQKSKEPEIGWDYCPAHRVFYTWREGTGIVESACLCKKEGVNV